MLTISEAGGRLDVALVAAAAFDSRAQAKEAIEAGLVSVDGAVVRKPAASIREGARLETAAPYPWVSRGGVKLAAGLDHFGFDPGGRICLDLGASTGGFTEVLLSRGAVQVFAVDVGHGQLHPRLRGDPRVVDWSGTDARDVPARLDVRPTLIVCDVSFIALRLALPPALHLAAPGCALVALIKPQFEVGKGRTSKGVVRDEALRTSACAGVTDLLASLGWTIAGVIASPITGGDGNVEYLVGAQKP